MSGLAPLQVKRRSDAPVPLVATSPDRGTVNGEVMELDPPVITPVDPWTELAEILLGMLAPQPAAHGVGGPAALSLDPAPAAPPSQPALDADGKFQEQPLADETSLPVPLDAVRPTPGDPAFLALAGKLPKPGSTPVEVPQFPAAQGKGIPAPAGQDGGPVLAAAPPAPIAEPKKPAVDGASPKAIVAQWQGGVTAAGRGMPKPKVAVPASAAADLAAKKDSAKARNEAAREGLVDEAKKVAPPVPVVENPPPPPPENPIPFETSMILAQSGKRLPDQVPPVFTASPQVLDEKEPLNLAPTTPTAGERPVDSDLFQILITPGAEKIAQIDPTAKDATGKLTPEAKKVDKALKQLAGIDDKEAPQVRGEPVTFQDLGPEPPPPLPEGLQIPVGQVIARLLAQTEKTAGSVLDRLRETAYPKGVLKTEFPQIGSGLLGSLTTEVGTELSDIAAAANISQEQLKGMIDERRTELAKTTGEATKDAAAKGKDATEAVRDEGQKTADSVAAAAKAAEEETLRRQEAAGGATDPTVINRRRDLISGWVREQVTVQTSNYQHAGEKRVGELNKARSDMLPAYTALVQRLTYEIMTPSPETDGRKSRDPPDKVREARLADDATVLRTWQDTDAKRIGEEVRLAVKLADGETKANRKAVEGAGDSALDAAKRWAEGRILEGKSFWDRFVALIESWLSDADTLNEQWRVRRTVENRDAVRDDLLAIEHARKRLEEGLELDKILADKSLTDAQKAAIKQFFEQPPGTSPLDFAALRLKQKIARGHLDAVRPVFEQELIAAPISDVEKLNRVAQAMTPGFDGAKIAQQVHGAMDQIGTDEDLIFSSLKGLSSFGGMVVRKFYTRIFGSNLDADLEDELSDNTFSAGGDLSRAKAELEGKVALGDALALHDAMAGIGTDEKAIMTLLRGKTPAEVEAIKAEYLAKFGESLDTALADDLSEGNEIDQANALLTGDTEKADAIALDEAMRGGIISSGTDEGEIERVQTTIRDEVMARAKSEHWTSQQAEAEVRRRMKLVEEKFGEKYKDVEQYNEPGLTGGSVLKRAFASELSGSELDLANALQDNDLIKADAARIEIERTGFYASDEKLVKVMRSQYERALESRRLDECPARQMALNREVMRICAEHPDWDANRISIERMRLEREMDKELDKGAQKDSKIATEALRSAYQGTYNRNLAYTLAFNTSGVDSEIALKLLEQGGKLSPLQEIDYATKGDGTDEEMLKKTFASLTYEEIQQVKKDWEAAHPGKDFYAMLHSELSGRDESDIMDTATHGAPESAHQRVEQEQRRVRREKEDLTGIVGGSVAGSEDAWMADQLKELEALDTQIQVKPSPDEGDKRLDLLDKVDFQVQRVQDAVEDHRRRIDSVTDSVTQVASIVAAVVVAAVVTVLTAGTMGPAAVAAVVALSSSLAATITTMATKQLILGGAYGAEDIGVDIAVGVVDAAVSVATAGMGDKLLRGFRAVAKKLPITKVAGLVTKSGIATKALETKGLGAAMRYAGKVLPTAEDGFAKFLASSSDNMLQSIPSTLTQTALSDQTWKGDPLMNFVSAGGMGMWQAFYMGHLLALPSKGLHNLTVHGVGKVQTHIDMGTEGGRLREAGKLIHDGHANFQKDSPGASMADFLLHPEGRKLRAELDAKGLLPTIESVNQKLAANPEVKAAMAGFDPAHPDAVAKAAELRQAQLTAALPDTAKKGTFVTPDSALTGNAVHVEPLRIGDRIVGVDVRVGPDATPLDIALHGATIDAMQKYTGVLGSIRRSLENATAILTGSGMNIGSKGWEARHEMAKLPAIIDARIAALEGGALTPELHAKTLADIDSLNRQFHEHEAIFHDETQRGLEGKGYIAAEAADDLHPLRKKLAKLEADFALKGERINAQGAITDLGRMELKEQLKTARQLINEAREKYPNDDLRHHEMLQQAKQVLELASDRYGLDSSMLLDFALDGSHRKEVKQLLRLSAGAETSAPAVAKQRDKTEVELDTMLGALGTADTNSPIALIERIRLGGTEGVRAQEALDLQSTAPQNAIIVNFPTVTLEQAFAAAGGTLHSGREGGKKVTVNGYEMFLFSPRPDLESGRLPPPKVAFEMDLPPRKAGTTEVFQFGDGKLRVWRGEATSTNPNGVLRQETIVAAGVDRSGHEEQIKTHGDGERTGAPTERAHLHGAGLGMESPFGIGPAPTEVNQILQNKGIEKFMRDLRENLPPGATLSYQTNAEFHPGSTRQARIEYKIDITIQGKRTTFAEFAIDIEADPAGTPREHSRGSHSSVADPIARRYSHESPAINRLFDALWESVNVPHVLTTGLAHAQSRNIVIQRRMSKMTPEAVAAGISVGADLLTSHRPPDQKHFHATIWSDQLKTMIANKDTPTFVVVDLRNLGLDQASTTAVLDAINQLPTAKRYRVIVLQ